MGVADRTLKTFDYISKGLLPSDDARGRAETLEEQILDCSFARRRVVGRQPKGRDERARTREGTTWDGALEGKGTEEEARRFALREKDRSYLIHLHSLSIYRELATSQYSCIAAVPLSGSLS